MTLSRIGATTLAQMKMMFRRRIVLFWSLVFPIILMALLGLLFGRDALTVSRSVPTCVVVALPHEEQRPPWLR